MRQALQLITNSAPAPLLPLLANPNDVRSVVHYLKKLPAGVTLDEAAEAVKRQCFDGLKLAAYEALGLTVHEGGRLKLTPSGQDMARQLASEVSAFRGLLDHVEPHRAALRWAFERETECLLHYEVAHYWYDNFSPALGLSDEKTLEGYTTCFFQLCQAAALGTHINGRKGQPSRLRLDMEALRDYLAAPPASKPEPRRPELTLAPLPADVVQKQVFVSYSNHPELAGQINEALSLADFTGHLWERAGDAGELIASGTLSAMRNCASGIFVLTRYDFNADGTLHAHLPGTLGAAAALYGNRVLLLHDKNLTLPPQVAAWLACSFEGEALTWANGACIVKTVKSFVAT